MDKELQELIQYHCGEAGRWEQSDFIALLRETQDLFGGILPEWALEEICEKLDVKPTYLKLVMRYVPDLKTEKTRHRLEICNGVNCQSNDSLALQRWVERSYDVKKKGISEKGGFSYNLCGCQKRCKEGPCVRWDGEVYTKMTAKKLEKLISKTS